MVGTIIVVSILEGFTTLAVQMIALRVAAPIVGSSVVLTSVYLGVVLLALSLGYYFGGRVAASNTPDRIRTILAGLLLASGIWYAVVTFGAHEFILELMLYLTGAYTFSLFVTAFVLFIIPLGMAAQTLPLLTQLLPESSKGKSAGLILFFSTIGSFLGSIITTIILFQFVGVATTSILTVVILGVCSALLLGQHEDEFTGTTQAIAVMGVTTLVAALMVLVNQGYGPETVYRTDSAYQTIEIQETTYKGEPVRLFRTNNSFASGIDTISGESFFPYIQEAVRVTAVECPKRVLVIGTAGFTYPQAVAGLECVEQIDAIDVDGKVVEAAELYFLQEKLDPKINVRIESGRNTIRRGIRNGDTYDLIFIDAYAGKYIPPELVTREFFESLQQIRSSQGTILVNMITDQRLQSKFIGSVIETFQQALKFNEFNADGRQVWVRNSSSSENLDGLGNYILSDRNHGAYRSYEQLKLNDERSVYTDNKSSAAFDINKLWVAFE